MANEEVPSLDDDNSQIRALAVSVAFCGFMEKLSNEHPKVTREEQIMGVMRAIGTVHPKDLALVLLSFDEGAEASVLANSVFQLLGERVNK